MNGRTLSVATLLATLGLFVLSLVRGSSAEDLPGDEPSNCLEPFYVKDCTGPAAGKTLCYYCRYGQRPVVCVFAREIDERTAQLIAQIDALVGQRREQRWAAFVVLLGEDTKAAERQLKACAARHKILHTPLTIFRDTPEKLTGALAVPGDTQLLLRHWRSGEIVSQRAFGGAVEEAEITDFLAVLAENRPQTDVP